MSWTAEDAECFTLHAEITVATSIQVIGEKAEFFEDTDLLLLLMMAVERVRRNPIQYDSLLLFADTWNEQCLNYGPGVLDLKLEVAVASAIQKQSLLELLTDLENDLTEFGATIPKAIVNSKWAVRGVRFNDYSTSMLYASLRKLRALIKTS